MPLRTALATLGGWLPQWLCASCSVGSGVAAATSHRSWGFYLSALPCVLILWWLPTSPLRVVAQYAPSQRGPPPRCSVVGGPPPLLLHPAPVGRAPATVVGGKGERLSGLSPLRFFVGCRPVPLRRLRRRSSACVRRLALTPFSSFRAITPVCVRCVLASLVRCRRFGSGLPRRSFIVVGGLSN